MNKKYIIIIAALIVIGLVFYINASNKENGIHNGEKTSDNIAEAMGLVKNEEEEVTKLPEITIDTTAEEEEESSFGPAELLCTLPKGFTDNGDNEGLYIYRTYPTDISTINHVISDDETNISDWSADDFKKQLEADYLETYSDQVDIQVVQFDHLRVDGRPGFRMLMEFDFKGVTYEQLMYAFYNGTESHYVYYTQEKGNKWMDAFVKSGESIHFRELDQ